MSRRAGAALLILLAGACLLRGAGWDRGDAVLEPGGTPAFYHFHPDETTLVRAALTLSNPLEPPLTAYGMLPMYVARVVLEASGFVAGEPVAWEDAQDLRFEILTLRALSLLVSLLTLVLTGWVARRVAGDLAGIAAVLLTGPVPLALQQAHFFTIDGLFALLALTALAAILRLDIQQLDWRNVALAGCLIGATGAVRLNGLLTGLVLLAAVALRLPAGVPRWRAALHPGVWRAGLLALGTLCVLQPHLLFEPSSMVRSINTDDFAYSVAIAQGDILRPWSLADLDTTPWLHYLTELWPQAAGWPLTLLLLTAWVRAVYKGTTEERLVALWCLLYVLTVGGLHTKHVRYLLPLLAPLGVLAASWLSHRWHSRTSRRGTVALVALCAAHAWAYGIAFSHIYRVDDARVAAARWLASAMGPGATGAVERGGFSLRGLLPPDARVSDLNTTTVFATRGYLTCGEAAEYLSSRLRDVEWVAITDVNRYRQFVAADRLYPVTASFYRSLVDGSLGYDLVRREKVYPRLAGITWRDDTAEPSFLGFDHPAVFVLRASDQTSAAVDSWRLRAAGLRGCPDADLVAAAAALRRGDLENVTARLDRVHEGYPGLAHLLRAMVHERQGDRPAAGQAMHAYSEGFGNRSLTGYLLPWASAVSLSSLDLSEEAVRLLELGWERREGLAPDELEIMARSYLHAGVRFREHGRADLEEKASLMAADLWEAPPTLNAAAQLIYDRGDARTALSMWERSLEMRADQLPTRLAAGDGALATGDGGRALDHFRTAARLILAGRPAHEDQVRTAARGLRRLGAAPEADALLRATSLEAGSP